MGYLGNFIVYTFAMVGVIVLALLVFKNSTSAGINRKSKYLSVIDSLSLAPRKNLYIVSAGDEKFLIAGDVDKTTLISKLNDDKSLSKIENLSNMDKCEKNVDKLFAETSVNNFRETMNSLAGNRQYSYMDKSDIGINSSLLSSKNRYENYSVIRNIAEKMRG